MEEFESRYLEVMVNPEQLDAARALKPIHERPVFGRSVMLFDNVDRQKLAALGEVRRPSIADLFVAVMGREERSAAFARGYGAPRRTEGGGTRSGDRPELGGQKSEVRERN
jgi:ABC-2 type transport system ATP-binding protein